MRNEEKNNEKLPDFLANMKDKKEGYEVPFNYFENLENSIMDTIYTENRRAEEVAKAPSFWQSLFQKRAPIYAFGMAAILVGIFYWMQPTVNVLEDDMLTADNVEEYIEENIDDFSYEFLIDEMTEEETALLNYTGEDISPEDIPDEYWDAIDDEDIEEYL